jgi:hypothetical protein
MNKSIKILMVIIVIIALTIYPCYSMAQVARTVSLQTDVQEYLNFSITAGGTVGFGNLMPGTAIAAPATGTVTSITTNAANGYTISLSDNVLGTNSALVKGGVYILDFTGTIAAPVVWVNGTSIGLGVTLYTCATPAHKDVKWGAGVSFDDALNNYAGIPETTTIANSVTGYHVAADVCSWAFKLDVSPLQEGGVYSGPVTFTATAVLL